MWCSLLGAIQSMPFRQEKSGLVNNRSRISSPSPRRDALSNHLRRRCKRIVRLSSSGRLLAGAIYQVRRHSSFSATMKHGQLNQMPLRRQWVVGGPEWLQCSSKIEDQPRHGRKLLRVGPMRPEGFFGLCFRSCYSSSYKLCF